MNLSLPSFVGYILSQPLLFLATLLTVGVIFVNGWTDAPNAIATCVATRAISPKKAVIMAAFFNFLGVLFMTLVNTKVAITVKNMVNFGNDNKSALTALTAALFSIIIWAVSAWYFGIPTSESHALIAGLSGSALALQHGISGINVSEWLTVIYGLVLSTVLGFVLGFITTKITEFLLQKSDRNKTRNFFKYAEIFGGSAMSFMHGAQDGQKFIGVMLLGLTLSNNSESANNVVIPVWMMLFCSVIMATGTAVGGYKIIKSVGMDMVKLDKHRGFCADLSGALCLLISSLFGLPVSTTHTKTTAIMGVGAAKRISDIDFGIVKEMVSAWLLTFPCCMLIGYVTTKLFTVLF